MLPSGDYGLGLDSVVFAGNGTAASFIAGDTVKLLHACALTSEFIGIYRATFLQM